MPDSCVRRKTGTATNSRLWNWMAVPGLPTADAPSVASPLGTVATPAVTYTYGDEYIDADFYRDGNAFADWAL